MLDLLERIKSGRYRAPPVRRAYIPKADGSQRMLGIPTFEHKVAQRAVTMVLEAVYEQEILALFLRLPPGPLGSPGAPHFAERTLGQATLLGDRHRHTQVFRFDSALSPPDVPRPTSHGRHHPTDDRQMAEGGGRRRRLLRHTTEGSPQGGRSFGDLADTATFAISARLDASTSAIVEHCHQRRNRRSDPASWMTGGDAGRGWTSADVSDYQSLTAATARAKRLLAVTCLTHVLLPFRDRPLRHGSGRGSRSWSHPFSGWRGPSSDGRASTKF